MSTAMHMTLDRACLDLKNLPDDDLIALLCAAEDEIEAYGELQELKELLFDCTKELMKRPALLVEMSPAREAPGPKTWKH
jgi:hypothetical protein